jgi:hypothetical protein
MVGHMHITARRFLFAFFALVFVVAAPLVVLYTAGYRLNISNRRLQQTGVLAITTFPRGGSIVLNGQNLAQKTPYVVQRVMPSMHSVVLNKKGYHEWSQRVRVDEGRTSYITARLFADSQPTLLNATASALALRSRESTELITVDDASVTFLNNGANVEVHTGSGTTDQLIALLPINDYQLLEDDATYILIVDERNVAFVVAREGGEVVELPTRLTAYDWMTNENLLIWTDGTEVNIYDANTDENTFITRNGQSIVDVVWHPEADSFFIATPATIEAYDRSVHETREVTPLLSEAVIDDIWVDDAGKNLYYLDHELVENTNETTFVYELPLTL